MRFRGEASSTRFQLGTKNIVEGGDSTGILGRRRASRTKVTLNFGTKNEKMKMGVSVGISIRSKQTQDSIEYQAEYIYIYIYTGCLKSYIFDNF